jgi:hypothetical protein
MNNVFHGTLTLLLTICLCSAAYAESDGKNIQDAEFKFRIQMTSALNNDPKAQFLVAEMYEQGMGTPQNIRMAHLWYSKSANQGYQPAVEKLANWGREKQQAETRSGERADRQQRRQAEAEAAKAERERADQQKRQQAEAAAAAKAARERADQQKRRQAEADAAAAKAAKERADQQKRQQAEAAAAAVTAAKAERERSDAQKRRQAEAETAAAATAKAAQAVEIVPVAKEKRAVPDPSMDNKAKTIGKSAEKGPAEFRANPCNSATAKFTSTCQ